MKKKRFKEEQIIRILREAEKGQVSIQELCRQHGVSEQSYYRWRKKFGGMEVSDAKRLQELERENAQLKKLPMGTEGRKRCYTSTLALVTLIFQTPTVLVVSSCDDCSSGSGCEAGFFLDIAASDEGPLIDGNYVTFILTDQGRAVVTCEIDDEAALEEQCVSETTEGEIVVEAAPSCASNDCAANSISMIKVQMYVPSGTEGGNPNFVGPEHVEVEVNMVGEKELLGSASYDPQYDRINYKGREGCGWCDVSDGRSTLTVRYPESL